MHFAVWDGPAEYRLLVYTSAGHLRFNYIIAPVATKPTVQPLGPSTASNVPPPAAAPTPATASNSIQTELSTTSPPVRAQRVVHASRAKKTTPGRNSAPPKPAPQDPAASLPKHAGGGLGLRKVSWNPTGNLLAVGGYDEKVCLLSY